MEKTLVTYVQSKHHDLRIQTMYSGKRKSLAITPSDVNIFSQTSETLNGIAFKNIISCAKAAPVSYTHLPISCRRFLIFLFRHTSEISPNPSKSSLGRFPVNGSPFGFRCV